MAYQPVNNFISFKDYIGSLEEIMNEVGYIKRNKHGDYVMHIGRSSRFHAHVCSVKKKTIRIHMDTTIDNRHVVFRQPLRINEERDRIYELIKYRHKDNPVRVVLCTN